MLWRDLPLWGLLIPSDPGLAHTVSPFSGWRKGSLSLPRVTFLYGKFSSLENLVSGLSHLLRESLHTHSHFPSYFSPSFVVFLNCAVW